MGRKERRARRKTREPWGCAAGRRWQTGGRQSQDPQTTQGGPKVETGLVFLQIAALVAGMQLLFSLAFWGVENERRGPKQLGREDTAW